ncbi:MAG: hypothetical protein U5L09_00210 [Bacteroidales bacterium]|nr:hypothetical protein [Bacteroidales bacterium]
MKTLFVCLFNLSRQMATPDFFNLISSISMLEIFFGVNGKVPEKPRDANAAISLHPGSQPD